MKTVAQPLAASVYVALSRLPYPRLNLECLINPNRKLSIARRPERGVKLSISLDRMGHGKLLHNPRAGPLTRTRACTHIALSVLRPPKMKEAANSGRRPP